jgi:hypothetical protein
MGSRRPVLGCLIATAERLMHCDLLGYDVEEVAELLHLRTLINISVRGPVF